VIDHGAIDLIQGRGFNLFQKRYDSLKNYHNRGLELIPTNDIFIKTGFYL